VTFDLAIAMLVGFVALGVLVWLDVSREDRS
jgi:hypothetical protein